MSSDPYFASYFVHRSSTKCHTSLKSSNKYVSVYTHRGLISASFLVSDIIIVFHRSNPFLSETGWYSGTLYFFLRIFKLKYIYYLFACSIVYQVSLRFSLLSWKRLLCRSTLLLSSSQSTMLLKVLKMQKKS